MRQEKVRQERVRQEKVRQEKVRQERVRQQVTGEQDTQDTAVCPHRDLDVRNDLRVDSETLHVTMQQTC